LNEILILEDKGMKEIGDRGKERGAWSREQGAGSREQGEKPLMPGAKISNE